MLVPHLASFAPSLLLSLNSATCRAPIPLLSGSTEWSPQEDWALLDHMLACTVGSGDHTATFWDALAASTYLLHNRTASECADRMAVISHDKLGHQPRRLDQWRHLPDGRFFGVEGGRTVYISVSEQGRLAEGHRPMYIESVSGRVYELAAAGDLAAFAAKADLTTTEPALSSASTCRAERIAMGSL
eukprot:CAMPEP_0119095758 /NCGR_PEP_ID=MMETSP1178-20130426/170656_1 /TAXON_ID=33656 /ORGANISM="unid sp, Strain CCMP2000" /LENGTH=186 /DNA_ID=CAMNT_0007079591 /DNA_START=28 /DNA_END=584 /DNA_ORIENTATION=+